LTKKFELKGIFTDKLATSLEKEAAQILKSQVIKCLPAVVHVLIHFTGTGTITASQ
jgi:hypothetical protein